MWSNLLAVAGGGAIGALARYGIALGFAGRFAFPWTTLIVNASGSLLFGLLAVYLSERMPLATDLRAFLLVGILGAFTTFSAFSWETLVLLQSGETVRALANVFANVVLCIAAAFTGIALARQLI